MRTDIGLNKVVPLDRKAKARLHDFIEFIGGWDWERVDKRLVLVTLITTKEAVKLGFPKRVRGYSYRMKSDKENSALALKVGMGRALKRMDHILNTLVENATI